MVMTHRVSPKASSLSVLALPLLFLMAWSIVPAKSAACPPPSDTPDAIDVAPEGQKFIRGRIESDADSFVVFVSDHGMKVCQQAPPKNVMTKHNYGDCTIYIAQESDCNPAAVEAPIVNIKPDVQEIVVYPIASPRGIEVTAGPARPAPFNKMSALIHGRRVNLDAGPQYGVLAVAEAPSGLSSVPVQIAIPTTDADGNWALISEIPADAVSPVLAVGTAGGGGVALDQPGADDSNRVRRVRIAQAPRSGGGSAHSHGDDDDRIARLERQISNLSNQLAELSESLQQRQPDRLPRVQVAPPTGMTITPTPPKAPSGTLWTSRAPTAAGSPMIARKYTLTEGKLEALTKLMVRSDVKTRVRPLDDGIEVHGTAADHEKFALFIELISGKGMDHKVTYHLPEEKMADLTRLMERDDVPVFIHRGKGEITVQGNELVQRVFKDFLELLHSSGEAVSSTNSNGPELSLKMGEAARAYSELANRKHAVEREMSSAKKRAEIDRLRVKAQQLQQQAETLEQRADELVEQAEETAEEAAAIKERAGSDAAKADYRRVLDELKRRAKEFDVQAEATYREAQDLEANAESIEEQIDQLEDELAVALSGR